MDKSERTLLRGKAVNLRKQGFTYSHIEKKLQVPRSTVDYWLNGLLLSPDALAKLRKSKDIALAVARKKASIWHREQKEKRLKIAEKTATDFISKKDVHSLFNLKLALAILYLGEGGKSKNDTNMGSSDPTILRFFILSLMKLYGLKKENFRCQLNLRMDQNKNRAIKYWSKELTLPPSAFNYIFFDKRGVGKTYDSYKGVCLVRCGNVAIQRELLWISRLFCGSIS